mgnify:CR=1 FL=1
MNLKKTLENMDLSDLRFICKELRVYCPKTKNSIINKLLQPLSKKLRFISLQEKVLLCDKNLKLMEWDGWESNEQWENHVEKTLESCNMHKTCNKIDELGVVSKYC